MRVSVNLNAQKPDTTTNAVIYARYSSHGQTEQSIEGQLAKGHEYAAAQGYTVVHEYIDRAMTGRNDNREAFQKMLSDTGKHQFQVVIVWKVDRFGRNREEIAFNKHTCKKNGVRRGKSPKLTGSRYSGERTGGYGGILFHPAIAKHPSRTA